MTSKSSPVEFEIEAVRHVPDRGYKPQDVAERLSCSTREMTSSTTTSDYWQGT